MKVVQRKKITISKEELGKILGMEIHSIMPLYPSNSKFPPVSEVGDKLEFWVEAGITVELPTDQK